MHYNFTEKDFFSTLCVHLDCHIVFVLLFGFFDFSTNFLSRFFQVHVGLFSPVSINSVTKSINSNNVQFLFRSLGFV